MFHHRVAVIVGGIAIVAIAPPAAAWSAERRVYDLPAQPLGDSLRAVSLRSGTDILAAAALVADRRAPALKGSYTVDEALDVLLAGSGLRRRGAGATIVIELEPAGSLTAAGPDILITGSRIRGAPVASPVIKLNLRTIRDAGQATVAEAARSVPQNFGGGQNPGIGNNVPGSNGVNVGGASSINLRGLGSDATLTLVNGHRLSYSASRQAIDISTIPLGAVDRIEIVPDGASALYGSDAVAGVANIILRRDFSGAETSARLGTSTDGGDFEQRYGLVAGQRWASGGVILAYEFGRNSAINGADRSYAADRPRLTLLPLIRNHSVSLSAHQALTPALTFELDAFYNNRFTSNSYALSAAPITTSGGHGAFTTRSFVVAPTLRLTPGGDWQAFLIGSYGQDHTRYDVVSYSGGKAFPTLGSCYCNNAKSAEIGGDGSLFALPGGKVKLAVGAGYRANNFIRFNGVGATTNVAHNQDSYYAYGEISVPLVSPAQGIAGVDRLSASAAVRYERYPGIGAVATPKVGAIYAPTPDFDLKGSWGKSFRAPTLYQQYQSRSAILVTPPTFGGTGYPAGSTAFFLQGGNSALRPERATSWSITLDVHPRKLDGFDLQLSYFSTRYRDRIVTPIAFTSQALSNPIYADRLTANPSAALLAGVIASTIVFSNTTGTAYDPSKVAVLIDNSNVNAGRQNVRGVDALLSYRKPLAGDSAIRVTADLAWLESNQQLGPSSPVTQLAGVLFNPPHIRGRSTASWSDGGFALTGAVNYMGGVDDTRKPTILRVGSMTTFDLSARYRTKEGGPLGGLELVASVQNLLNATPSPIATTLLYDAPYDSTNYSPVGRFVSLSVSKKW
jgi:outer membrane receptor protein involved in Fe transport